MIEVSVLLDPSHSTLKHVEFRGHSGEAGDSLVCAAVTAVGRTAARTVEGYGKFRIEGDAESPGNLHFSVDETEDTQSGDYIWLMGVTDSLLTGIRDISREYPAECTLEVVSHDATRQPKRRK